VSAPNSRRRPSLVLLVVLLAALATGAAASLLIGAATAPGAPPPAASELVIPAWVVVDGVAGFAVILVGLLIYQRVSGGSVALPSRFVVTFLVAILVAILLIVAFRALGGIGPSPTGAVSNGQNSTGTLPSNSTGTNVTSHGGGSLSLLPSLPGWVPFVAIAAVLVLAVVVALPFVSAYAQERKVGSRRPSKSPSTDEVRRALDRATQALDEGGDPRAVIVRLYSDLLERVSPVVPHLDPATPEEIRRKLVELGIQTEAATVLTRLFEEARYSTHALGPEAAEQVHHAVETALADLARASVTA
jgi:hypothetical protein